MKLTCASAKVVTATLRLLLRRAVAKERGLTMHTILFVISLLLGSAYPADNPIARWENAVGGRDKVAAIKAVYREATVELGNYQGTIKVWHTAEGKYRKEEQIATFSTIETFDGVNGSVQQGAGEPRKMTPGEVQQTISKRFANSNAMFFAFFPERRFGNVAIEGDNVVALKAEGGIEWRVTLDPETSLPRTMVHVEGERTITVTFDSYETVDGVKFEKEMHRSAGDPRMGAVIHFTKTVINPPLDQSLFSMQSK